MSLLKSEGHWRGEDVYRLTDRFGNVVGSGETPEDAVEDFEHRYGEFDGGSGDRFQIRFDGDDGRMIPVEF